MSTRAQIAIQTGPDSWAHVYVHFDGYPAHMLPALAGWKPGDILAAKEIRQVTPEALDCFSPPRHPRILPRPTREFAHLYIWTGGQWMHVVPLADTDRPLLGAPGVQSESTDIARNCLRAWPDQSDADHTRTMQLTPETPP